MGKYLGVKLLDHRVGVCGFYKKLPDVCPKWLHHLAFPLTVYEKPRYFTPSPAGMSVCLFTILATGAIGVNLHFPHD